MWKTFSDKLEQAEERCIPQKKVFINNQLSKRHSVRLDKKSLSKIKRKNRLWERYCKTQDGEVYLEFCRLRNQVRSITRKAKKALEKSVAMQAKKNPKKFWQFVNRKTKTKPTIPDLIIDDQDPSG